MLQKCYRSVAPLLTTSELYATSVPALSSMYTVYKLEAASWISWASWNSVDELGERAENFLWIIYSEAGSAKSQPPIFGPP